MLGDRRRRSRLFALGPLGSSTVELAFAIPLLIAVVVGTVDFARVFYLAMALTTAARAGAQFGAHSTTNAQDSAGITAAAHTAAQIDVPTLALTDITPACERLCEPDAPGDAAYSLTVPGGGSSCTSGSPTCGAGTHLIWVVTVEASKQFTTLGRYPGIPSAIPIIRRVKMRAQ